MHGLKQVTLKNSASNGTATRWSGCQDVLWIWQWIYCTKKSLRIREGEV